MSNVVKLIIYFFTREQLERVNIEFHPNGTVSYNEKRSFEFLPDKTRGSLRDKIIVPSIPIMVIFIFINSSPKQ